MGEMLTSPLLLSRSPGKCQECQGMTHQPTIAFNCVAIRVTISDD